MFVSTRTRSMSLPRPPCDTSSGVGLGSELQRTVRDALKRIATNPAAWPRWPDLPDVRVCPLSRFPFLLPYFLDEAQLVVLAVAHTRRRPGSWYERLQRR